MDLESSFELVERAQQGDGEALNRLLARYLPRIRRWASGRLPPAARDLSDTNDIVQEALMGMVRNLRTFEQRDEGSFQWYLRFAVMNRIRDEIRKMERRPGRDVLDSGLPSRAVSPLDAAIGAEDVECYERALAQLAPHDRVAVVANLEFGYTYEEVAALVGKPTAGAARLAIRRAIAKLAVLMANKTGD